MRTYPLFLTTLLVAVSLAFASGCCDSQSQLGLLSPARSESRSPVQRAKHIEFVNTFPEALQVARQTGKPLLVFFSTPECIYCQQMLQGAFRDHQVVELAEKFVCVQIEPSEAPEICEDYHIEAFPTVQFITPDGVPLHRILGKKEADVLASQMQAALQGPHARTAYQGDTLHR